MDLDDRILAAEADLNAALDHAQELAVARQQVLDALEDLRVYRNLLALQAFGVPRQPGPIPGQQRRRVTDKPKPPEPEPRRSLSLAAAYREAVIGPKARRPR